MLLLLLLFVVDEVPPAPRLKLKGLLFAAVVAPPADELKLKGLTAAVELLVPNAGAAAVLVIATAAVVVTEPNPTLGAAFPVDGATLVPPPNAACPVPNTNGAAAALVSFAPPLLAEKEKPAAEVAVAGTGAWVGAEEGSPTLNGAAALAGVDVTADDDGVELDVNPAACDGAEEAAKKEKGVDEDPAAPKEKPTVGFAAGAELLGGGGPATAVLDEFGTLVATALPNTDGVEPAGLVGAGSAELTLDRAEGTGQEIRHLQWITVAFRARVSKPDWE